MKNEKSQNQEWEIGDTLISVKSNSKAITIGKSYEIVSMLPYNPDTIFKADQKFSIVDDNGNEKLVHRKNVQGNWNHQPK